MFKLFFLPIYCISFEYISVHNFICFAENSNKWKLALEAQSTAFDEKKTQSLFVFFPGSIYRSFLEIIDYACTCSDQFASTSCRQCDEQSRLYHIRCHDSNMA